MSARFVPREIMLAACGLLLIPSVIAQLGLQVECERYRHLAYEPVELSVKVRNYSGNPLNFGAGGSMVLTVRHNGKILPSSLSQELGKNPIHGLTLPAGGEKTLDLQINNFAPIQKAGEYEAVLMVGHERLPNAYRSRPTRFSVEVGASVWERSVGVPRPNSDGPIRTRKISVVRFRGDDGAMFMLRIEDASYVYAVRPLGASIIGVKPEGEIDARSFIHTLVRTAPRQFDYRVFDLSGTQKDHKIYLYEGSNPRLVRDPDLGRVMVAGGRQAVEGVDYNLQGNFGALVPLDDEEPEESDSIGRQHEIIEDLPDLGSEAKDQ